MAYYINCVSTNITARGDLKQLIPDMNMRRRMSSFVKMGVGVALETMDRFGDSEEIDAIVTATAFGCVTDSEKFLTSLIDSEEQMLNPTPFIQSTFNTIGANIAILCKNHSYNMTHSHGVTSFESALLDAMLRIDAGESATVLIGAMDEKNGSLMKIMERMRIAKEGECADVAVFFVLTAQKQEKSVAMIESFCFGDEGEESERTLRVSEMNLNGCFVASALLLSQGVEMVTNGAREVTIVNDSFGKVHTKMKIRCI